MENEKRESEEVVRLWFSRRDSSTLLRSSFKDGEITLEVFIKFQDGSNVATTVAVVRSRPYSEDSFIEMPFESFHDQLVSTTYHFYIVGRVELGNDVRSEEITCSSWRHSPSLSVFGIRPQKVTHWTIMWHFLLPINHSDLVQCLNGRRETTMNTENTVVDDG